MGECPVGDCPVGECPVGDCPVGECPVGECPTTIYAHISSKFVFKTKLVACGQ